MPGAYASQKDRSPGFTCEVTRVGWEFVIGAPEHQRFCEIGRVFWNAPLREPILANVALRPTMYRRTQPITMGGALAHARAVIRNSKSGYHDDWHES